MKTRVRKYIDECKAEWDILNSKPNMPQLYDQSEKMANQAILEEYAQALKKLESKSSFDKEKFKEGVKKEAVRFLKSTFGLNDREVATIANKEFSQSTNKFIQMARQFDSSIKIEDIYQASRNLWIINTIQMLMGKEVDITPSLFAYSMLYPYTDNYLDDHSISSAQKMEFSRQFRLRLAGEFVPWRNEHERKIYDLVNCIESDWDRKLYPDVYNSLLAIQDAQTRSIELLSKQKDLPEELLMDICIDKGGTSVLADGYLINGTLTEEEERFMFQFGTWLQFVDDIQDINDDINEEICTAFTQAAKEGNLTLFTDRSLMFFASVKNSTSCFEDCEQKSDLVSIMQKSVSHLILEAVATNQRFHSQEECIQYELHSSLTFDFIKTKKSKSQGNNLSIIKKMETIMSQNVEKPIFSLQNNP